MIYNEIDTYLKANQYHVSLPIKDFISEVSNIYHEIESKDYHIRHQKMFKEASKYWREIIDSNIQYFDEDLTLLDYGCGTGFEIMTILNSPLKKKISKIVCYDLSKDMLKKCKENIEKEVSEIEHIKIEYVADVKDIHLNDDDKGFDLILTNALLHHLPDLHSFFELLKDKLSQKGIFIMGHEPNTNFYHNEYLLKKTKQFRIYKRLISNLSLNRLLLKLRIKKNEQNDINYKTNKILLERKMINKELPPIILSKLVDIHVPIGFLKNQVWGEMGFNEDIIVNKYMSELKLIDTKSYFHIKDYKSIDSLYWKSVSKSLSKNYPCDGADCILMFQRD